MEQNLQVPNVNLEKNSLSPFMRLITIFETEYPNHPNLYHARKLILAYEFIGNNYDYIEHVVQNWWTVGHEVFGKTNSNSTTAPFQWHTDREKGVLRTPEDVSFHPCSEETLYKHKINLNLKIGETAKKTMQAVIDGWLNLFNFILTLKENTCREREADLIILSILNKLFNSKGCVQGNTAGVLQYLADLKRKYDENSDANLIPSAQEFLNDQTQIFTNDVDELSDPSKLLEFLISLKDSLNAVFSDGILTIDKIFSHLADITLEDKDKIKLELINFIHYKKIDNIIEDQGGCKLSFNDKDMAETSAIIFQFILGREESFFIQDFGNGKYTILMQPHEWVSYQKNLDKSAEFLYDSIIISPEINLPLLDKKSLSVLVKEQNLYISVFEYKGIAEDVKSKSGILLALEAIKIKIEEKVNNVIKEKHDLKPGLFNNIEIVRLAEENNKLSELYVLAITLEYCINNPKDSQEKYEEVAKKIKKINQSLIRTVRSSIEADLKEVFNFCKINHLEHSMLASPSKK